jgi:hypothetical protein
MTNFVLKVRAADRIDRVVRVQEAVAYPLAYQDQLEIAESVEGIEMTLVLEDDLETTGGLGAYR